MNTKSKILWVIVLLIVCVIGYTVGSMKSYTVQKHDIIPNTTSEPTLDSKSSIAQKLEELENEKQSLERQNQEIKNQLDQVKKEQEERKEKKRKEYVKMAESTTNRRINRIFYNLQSSVTISEEQLAIIENFFNHQRSILDEYRKPIAEREFNWDNWNDYWRKEHELLAQENIEDFLINVLSNEQIKAYEVYKDQRQKDTISALAYSELSKLLKEIPLTEEQKDVIFESNIPMLNDKLKKDAFYKKIFDENQWILYESSR